MEAQEDLCAFCLDRIQNPEKLHCNHAFCKDCLEMYLEARNWVAERCPICRRSLDWQGAKQGNEVSSGENLILRKNIPYDLSSGLAPVWLYDAGYDAAQSGPFLPAAALLVNFLHAAAAPCRFVKRKRLRCIFVLR